MLLFLCVLLVFFFFFFGDDYVGREEKGMQIGVMMVGFDSRSILLPSVPYLSFFSSLTGNREKGFHHYFRRNFLFLDFFFEKKNLSR